MFEVLKEYWKEDMIDRANVERITGGVITETMLRKFDTNKTGITNKALFARKVYYQLNDVIKWLDKNTKQV